MAESICVLGLRSAAAPFAALLAALAPLAAAAAADPPLPAEGTCTGPLTQGSDATCRLKSGRYYLIHVPKSYAGGKSALVLDLHGYTTTAEKQRGYSGQLQQSDRLGFIAVWPQGYANSWNAGTWTLNGRKYACCGAAAGDPSPLTGEPQHPEEMQDDVGVLKSMVADVESRHLNIDSDKVYLTGLSNGGAMTQRMACEASDVFHAFAAVSFPLNPMDCRPSKARDVITIQGKPDLLHVPPITGDPIVPYDGGFVHFVSPTAGVLILRVVSAEEGLTNWAKAQSCAGASPGVAPPGDPTPKSYEAYNKDGTVEVQTYPNCKGGAKVRLISLPTNRHIPYDTFPQPSTLHPNAQPQGEYLRQGGDGVSIAGYLWNTIFAK